MEAERLAKMEAERLAKMEAERLAKMEAERLAKMEAERLAKMEDERLAKIEAERLAKIEAELLSRGKKAEPEHFFLNPRNSTMIAFSENMGAEVFAIGNQWCRSEIDIAIKVEKASPLFDHSEIVKFIQKLKTPIKIECNLAKSAKITVVDQNSFILNKYKASKSESWEPFLVQY
jgi:methylase of polypeptide subunit release factors